MMKARVVELRRSCELTAAFREMAERRLLEQRGSAAGGCETAASRCFVRLHQAHSRPTALDSNACPVCPAPFFLSRRTGVSQEKSFLTVS